MQRVKPLMNIIEKIEYQIISFLENLNFSFELSSKSNSVFELLSSLLASLMIVS